MSNAQVQLPRYKCHKEVWAFEIGKIEGTKIHDIAERMYVEVSPEYISKHTLNLPGYYVRYKDGYESWSPKQAFEEGYSKGPDVGDVEIDNEGDRMMSVNDAGHSYELHNLGTGVQKILFIKKEPVDDGINLDVVHDGTTTEAVLQVALHRLEVLNERLPDSYNNEAIAGVRIALGALINRTNERKARGVEGTLKA